MVYCSECIANMARSLTLIWRVHPFYIRCKLEENFLSKGNKNLSLKMKEI